MISRTRLLIDAPPFSDFAWTDIPEEKSGLFEQDGATVAKYRV